MAGNEGPEMPSACIGQGTDRIRRRALTRAKVSRLTLKSNGKVRFASIKCWVTPAVLWEKMTRRHIGSFIPPPVRLFVSRCLLC